MVMSLALSHGQGGAMDSQQWTDTHTPALSVLDSRGLAVRSVAYCRHPKNPSIEPRITRNHFDAAGRQIASWDPRLWGGRSETEPRDDLQSAKPAPIGGQR